MPPPTRPSDDIRKDLHRRDTTASVFIPRSRKRCSSMTTRASSLASAVFDDTDELNSLASENAVFGQARAMNFTGPGVRPQRNGKYLTKAERRLDRQAARLAREAKNLHVDGTELLRNRFRLQRVTVASALRNEYVLSEDGEVAFVDPTEEEEDDDDPDAEQLDETDTAQLYCACRSNATALMVPCQTCEAKFHPGCIGKGSYNLADYLEDAEHRESCFRADHKLFTQGRRYTCQECDMKTDDALRLLETGITERERRQANRQQTRLLKQRRQDRKKMERVYKPKPADAKRQLALLRATTDKERKEIEFEYEFARAMDIDGDDSDDGWGDRPPSPEDPEEREIVRKFDTYKEVREAQEYDSDNDKWDTASKMHEHFNETRNRPQRRRRNDVKIERGPFGSGFRTSTGPQELIRPPGARKRVRENDGDDLTASTGFEFCLPIRRSKRLITEAKSG